MLYFNFLFIALIISCLPSCQEHPEEKIEVEEIVLSQEEEELAEWEPSSNLIGDAASDSQEKILEEKNF